MILDGSFVLEPASGFQASQGQIFELLTYQSRRGMFASHTAPPLPGGAAWIPEYASSAFRLRVGAGVQALALNSTDRNGFEPGGALALDGRDDYAEVPHADELNAFPLTVMAWVRTTRNTSEINGIISKQVISSATGYSLVLHEGRVRAWYFRDPSTSASPEGGLDGGFIADGSWHHIAFAVDQLGSVLFVDGVQKAEYGWNSVTPSDDGFGGPATTVATLIFGNLEGQANGFAGAIDEISLWNAFLSELEIIYYKARRVDHADSSQIIGIWHFDEKSGNSAGDATDNGHAAVLKNGASWIDSPVPATTAP
jgi:hypothetical protein